MQQRKTLSIHRAFVFWIFLFAGNTAGAQEQPLEATLTDIIRSSPFAASTGVKVIARGSEKTLFSFSAEQPLSPASNVKILTAYALLETLGPDFRIKSAVHGHVSNGKISEGLFLRSEGDPSLLKEDFLSVALSLRQEGITSVDRVVIDSSFFDKQILPPGYEQQPREDAAFRAPVGAVSIDSNAYTIEVTPSAAKPKITVSRPAYLRVNNQLKTGSGAGVRIKTTQFACGKQLCLNLFGRIGKRASPFSLRRRVIDPGYSAGWALIQNLNALGIEVEEPTPLLGTTPSDAPLLWQKMSEPLSKILYALGKQSNNFYAEMLVKLLGARSAGAPGSTEKGLAKLRTLLSHPSREALINGSGLFVGNLLSPTTLVNTIELALNTPRLRPEFLAQLSCAGQDGTLERRLRRLPKSIHVRAKTGTLHDAVALSGVIQRDKNRDPWVFSILVNRVGGHYAAARALTDRLLKRMARAAR